MTRPLVVVNAGTSDPSSTRLLADRVAQRVTALSTEPVEVRVVDLRAIATEVTTALVAQHVGPELRAAVALGERLAAGGRGAEARDLVRPVVDSFTEGADAPDLVAARAFLARLP